MKAGHRWSRKKRRKEADPTAAEQLVADGAAHQEAGRFDEARKAYLAARKAAPELAIAHEMLGALSLQRGDPDTALGHLERAIELDADADGAHANRGSALEALGRVEPAIDAYRTAVQLNPNNLTAHNNLGNLLAQRGDRPEARAAYERALELDPSFFPAAANRARLMGLMVDEPFETRLAAFDEAIAIGRRRGLTGSPVARLHHGRGLAYREVERFEQAQREFERAVSLDTSYATAHLNLGRALAAQGKLSEAIGPMRKAVAASDDPSEAYGALTTLLCRAGRLDEAAEVFGQWHVAQPDNPVAAHMVAALTGGESPERASDAYLREEFDGFAEQFETVLAKLDYQAPQLVQPLVEKYAPQPCTKILDAGCGTGLCAPFLRPRTETLVGVDLSTKMLEVAAKRDAYDELVESELTAYLRSNPSAFDCIVATDVLIYFGRLEELVGGFAGALRPGGLLAISLEEAATGVDEYRLNPGGRYEHSEAYSRRTLSEAGLELIALERAILRRERNEDVGGMIVAARVP